MAHSLDLRTLPQQAGEAVPAAVQLKVKDFLTTPSWTLLTSLNQAPVEALLPLARRMGIAIPTGATIKGAMNGTVNYSSRSWILGRGFAAEGGRPTARYPADQR